MLYNGGQTTFSGFYWMDTICLWQVEIESERVPNSGGFCVNNQPFLAVEDINPNFSFKQNGVFGLAPSQGTKSFIKSMKWQNIIQKQIVAINLEET